MLCFTPPLPYHCFDLSIVLTRMFIYFALFGVSIKQGYFFALFLRFYNELHGGGYAYTRMGARARGGCLYILVH